MASIAERQALAELPFAGLTAERLEETVRDGSAEAAARLVAELLGAVCVVALLSEEGERFELLAVSHRSEPAAKRMRDALSGADAELERWPLVAGVIRTGEPVLMPRIDDASTMNPAFRDFIERTGAHSVLLVPLRARERAIGTICAIRVRREPAFDEEPPQARGGRRGRSVAPPRQRAPVPGAAAARRDPLGRAADPRRPGRGHRDRRHRRAAGGVRGRRVRGDPRLHARGADRSAELLLAARPGRARAAGRGEPGRGEALRGGDRARARRTPCADRVLVQDRAGVRPPARRRARARRNGAQGRRGRPALRLLPARSGRRRGDRLRRRRRRDALEHGGGAAVRLGARGGDRPVGPRPLQAGDPGQAPGGRPRLGREPSRRPRAPVARRPPAVRELAAVAASARPAASGPAS